MLRPAGTSKTTKALIIRLSDIDFGNVFGVAELGYDKFIVRAPKNNTSKNAELIPLLSLSEC